MPKKPDRSKLVPKHELIARNGKIYEQIVYINPDKEHTPAATYRKAKPAKPVKQAKYVGTVRQDHAELTRGAKVTLTYQGKEVEGEFRHIAITPRYPNGKAVVRIQLESGPKLVERNTEELGIVKDAVMVRPKDEASFSVGDKVQFTLRGHDAAGKPCVREVTAILSRFKGEPDSKGQLVHLRMGDGNIKERYLHNVTRYEDRIDPLTPEQTIVVNRAIDDLRNQNKTDFDLVKVYSGKRDSDVRIAQLKAVIQARNENITTHLQVLRRELPFDRIKQDIVIGSEGEDEQGKYRHSLLGKVYYEHLKPDDPVVEEEPVVENNDEEEPVVEDPAVTHARNLAPHYDSLERLERTKRQYEGQGDYGSQLQVYRAVKIAQRHMRDIVDYKQEHNLELTEAEAAFQAEPPAPPVLPVKPVEEDEDRVSTPLTRTVTTVSKNVKQRQKDANNEDKRKEIHDLIEKTKSLGLSEDTTEKLLARYEAQLLKLGGGKVRAGRGANTKSIHADLEKIANGQVASGFKINERIMALDATEEEKSALKVMFSHAIKAGLAKRKAADRGFKNELNSKNDFSDSDVEKAVTVPDSVFAELRSAWRVNLGPITLLTKALHAALVNQIQPSEPWGDKVLLRNSYGEMEPAVKIPTPAEV